MYFGLGKALASDVAIVVIFLDAEDRCVSVISHNHIYPSMISNFTVEATDETDWRQTRQRYMYKLYNTNLIQKWFGIQH